MRWDLFAILMLVPWAATFLGSLAAVKVPINTPRRQGGLLGFAAHSLFANIIVSVVGACVFLFVARRLTK